MLTGSRICGAKAASLRLRRLNSVKIQVQSQLCIGTLAVDELGVGNNGGIRVLRVGERRIPA